ncbi:MAG: prolipoprotein diacylglyceryl transferase [Proteobacteria bacterium]|jgi:phosphatidylglycerol:prolipoprotein diacylglycerol transferase|nr:prolipoprotein diacylglyceryl transferase [Pseudomonadota bacterium]MDA1134954.1 prolipoprotein diacylglyceryl transferase [Pseudomonadota bacterium]|tara:strand:+ start:1189 stop:1977 length:789 start_codon:yes stop_codon:yes gene_type:complete
MIEFPNINPIALDLGLIKIRWYAIAYLAGILFSWALILKIISIKKINLNSEIISELISNIIIGIILGGRLGYILFYNIEYFLDNFIEIFKIWNGGMSFHGGLIGVIIAVIYTAKKYDAKLMLLADLVAISAPIGIFFGRLANFINGELYGRITNHYFGIIFPNGGNLPRHPSQLYEAFFEGFLLFLILLTLLQFKKVLEKNGLLCGLFISLYGIFRFFIEFVREPDAHIGLLYLNFTMGQLLCLPMLIIGIFFIINSYRRFF